MMHSQEPRVSSSQDSLFLNINSSVSAHVKRLDSCTATQSLPKGSSATNEEEKKVSSILPWLPRFSILSRFTLGSRNIKQLKMLMSTYLGDISEMVKKSLKKTVRASKLKKNMSEVLVMFHLMYIDIREPFEQGSYMDTMSDLVAMYLDMEIRASKSMKESLPNVVSRLTMYLNILLGNSEAHILDTILKARLFNKCHEKICAPIIGKVLGSAKSSSMQKMLYVRYLLVYKLWKKVVSSGAERVQINKLAVQRLVAPPNLLDKSSEIFVSILPKKPKTKKNTTMFFMQAKFDLKKSVQAFLKFSKESQLSDFPAVAVKKPVPFSSPASFLDTESNIVCGDDSMSPFNDIWSSISSIDISFSEEAQDSPVTAVKKDREADVTSTQKSPKIKKYKKAKGKIKVLSNLIDKKKKKKNKPKSVKACTTISLNCIKPSVICCKTGKKSDLLFQKENSTLSVVDLASNLRALSTIDSSVTPDSVSATSSLSPKEVQSLQYESLSSTTSMENLPAGIPTPPASLPPPVAEQIPRPPTQAPVSGMTTSLEALLEGLPSKREQPDSDDGDREMAEVKCNVHALGNVPDSSDNMEVGEMDSKLSMLSSGRLTAESFEVGESSGCVVGFSSNVKGDVNESENRPLSRDSNVIHLGSEVDAVATLCMDIELEEENGMVEGTLPAHLERTGGHRVIEGVQDKTIGSGVCVIQKVSDIVKINSTGLTCVVDNEHLPVKDLASHTTANIPLCVVGSVFPNTVNSIVGVTSNNSLSTEFAGETKADMLFTDLRFDEPPVPASNSVDDIAGTEDSLSRESVTIIDATDTVATNGDIEVVGDAIPTSTASLVDSRNKVFSDSGNEMQPGENSVKTSAVTFDNVIVPCSSSSSSNVTVLPSNDLPVVDESSDDDVQIICERVTVPSRLPVKNESRIRDDFTGLQKDFFNSTEYDSDVEILEGLAKDTREDLPLSNEGATIARVEHRNELVVEQVLSGQFPVMLDLDNSQATLTVDINFCGAPPDSPPLNGGTQQFNEISPIINKTAGIDFGLYEKTNDKIQPGSTDPWLTDSANSFPCNFSRFSPVQETPPMDFLDDDDACSAYSSHISRFSEGGKRRSEEFRTKSQKEGSENLSEFRECNGLQSSTAIEESRTVSMPRPVSPVQQKESEQSVPLCSRKPSPEKLSVRIPQVNTVRHFTSSLPCDQQEDRSDGDGDSVVEPPSKVIWTSKSSLPNEEADYFRQISSVQLEHLSQETVAAQQPPERDESPATKALDEPKQLIKQTSKASPRGMCVDSDNDKLDIPVGNYTVMHPIPPYPPIPSAPLEFKCCCYSCCYCDVPVIADNRCPHCLHRYKEPQTESENQILLKAIEKTLSSSGHAEADMVNKDEQDTQYSTGKEISLPLKKRLKTIPPDPVSHASLHQRNSTCENLPSYQSRRMISIAELEVNGTLLKQWEVDQGEMRKSTSYQSHYSHGDYYINYQVPGKDVYAPQEELVKEKAYPVELLNNTQDYSYEKTPEVVYKDNMYDSAIVPVNYHHNKDANMNCVKMNLPFDSSDACRKQFKTPAELKQIPSVPDSLKELAAMTFQPGPYQSSADSGQYSNPIPNGHTDVYYPIANKESRQVLDLSVVKDVQYQKSARKRKPNIASDYNIKYSRKRCKVDSVVQATEMIDGFRVPYEKKRRKKSTR